MRHAGPQLIGRFDLASESWLAPIEVPAPGARSGIWDVLPLPDGRLLFTSYFELAGLVDPDGADGARVRRLLPRATG